MEESQLFEITFMNSGNKIYIFSTWRTLKEDLQRNGILDFNNAKILCAYSEILEV